MLTALGTRGSSSFSCIILYYTLPYRFSQLRIYPHVQNTPPSKGQLSHKSIFPSTIYSMYREVNTSEKYAIMLGGKSYSVASERESYIYSLSSHTNIQYRGSHSDRCTHELRTGYCTCKKITIPHSATVQLPTPGVLPAIALLTIFALSML